MKNGYLAIGCTCMLALSACATIDPYTGEEKINNTSKGAAIGVATGMVLGAITGDSSRERRKHMAIGAGIGALTGGSVGYYMDQQEAELRQQLQGTGVSVSRQGDNIVLNMPGNITFPTNQSAINANFYPVLDSVAIVLDKYEKTLVDITGHTDSTGSDSINQPLSERRALSVSTYLRSRDVLSQRIQAVGYGSNYPVASNESVQGRAQNRRVEITMVPLTSG